jgi:hypothetical protein
MRSIKQSLLLSGVIGLSACSRIGSGSSSTELFKLRAECANQARQFERDWRRDNGSDFQFLVFQYHYNQIRAGCFVRIYYGNAGLNMETVYDALDSVSRQPIVLIIGPGDKASNESKEHRDLAAKIQDYMGEETVSK